MPGDVLVAAIAVALYVSPYSCAAWRRMGPAGVAAYTARVLADPHTGLPATIGRVLAADRAGQLADPARWAAACRHAHRTASGPATRPATRPAAQSAGRSAARSGSVRGGRA